MGEVLYELCLPYEGTRVEDEFRVLQDAFSEGRHRYRFAEELSLLFTEEEAVRVLSDSLNITEEEARRRFKRLIRRKNIIGVYLGKEIPRVTIGEDATIE